MSSNNTYTGTAFQVNPATTACNWYVTQGPHTSSMQIAMGDGSVRGVNTGVSLATWTSACTRDSPVPLGSDW